MRRALHPDRVSVLLIAVFVTVAVAAAAFWGVSRVRWTEARKRQESEVLALLRSIASGQKTFREGDMDHDGCRDYAMTLDQLHDAGLIDENLASGVSHGYRFSLSGSTFDWWCKAIPEPENRLGEHTYGVWTEGVIRPFPRDVEPHTGHVCPP